MTELKRDDYKHYCEVTYAGRKLLREHKLSDVGQWTVRGEDPNCDWGGSHQQPYLGTYEGKLEDVIREAITLAGFWQWGAGGTISLIKVQSV